MVDLGVTPSSLAVIWCMGDQSWNGILNLARWCGRNNNYANAIMGSMNNLDLKAIYLEV